MVKCIKKEENLLFLFCFILKTFDEVYQAAMAAGSGGIRWNSEEHYIQLADENKNWINWLYHNPNDPVSLIPIMNSDSVTRSDGTDITLSCFGSMIVALYNMFSGAGLSNYSETGVPGGPIIIFSKPQLVTSIQWYNYHSNSTITNVSLRCSNDGNTYDTIKSITTTGVNNGIETILIDNPQYYRYYNLYVATSGTYNSRSFILRNCTFKGYTY